MFKIHEIREMIRLIDQSSVSELVVEDNGSRISIKKNAVAVATSIVVPQQEAPATPVMAAPAIQEAKAVAQEVKSAVQEAAPALVEAVQPNQALKQIVSPMVGTFYCAPEAGAAPFVKQGDQVEPSTVVCIVEAMKLFNEIEAEVKGKIAKVLVENGQLVEYGQPLFLVEA